MGRGTGRGVGLTLCLAVCLPASRSLSWEQSQDLSGAPLSWNPPTVELEISAGAQGSGGQPASGRGLLWSAAESWSLPLRSSLQLNFAGEGRQDFAPGDGRSQLLMLETSTWPAVLGDANSTAAATLLQTEADGRITEGDVTFNGVSFLWSTGVATPERLDLRTIAVHEMGHLLGLAHPCDVPGLPSCASLTGRQRDSVMWPAAVPGDVARRAPGVDDLDGLVALYGTGKVRAPDGVLAGTPCGQSLEYWAGESGEPLARAVAWPWGGGLPISFEIDGPKDRQILSATPFPSGPYDLTLVSRAGGARTLLGLPSPGPKCEGASAALAPAATGCAQGTHGEGTPAFALLLLVAGLAQKKARPLKGSG